MKTKILSILSGISTNPAYLLKFTLLLMVSFFCWFTVGFAQVNLVPNPSFEDYTTCPISFGQIDRATGWVSCRNTPDYFNTCSSSSWASIPANGFGYHYPLSGSAYAGFWAKSESSEFREHLGSQLLSNMQIGIRYYVSIKVSLSAYLKATQYCGVNKLGILFSTVQYGVGGSPSPINNNAQVYSNSIITDTLNWIAIQSSFIADSNYSFVSIGNFFNNSLTDSIQIAGTQCQAHYYLDDICVSTDSAFAYNYIWTGEKETINQPNISVYPNPVNDFVNIDFSGLSEPYTIKIENMFGEQVFFKQGIIESHEHIPIAKIKGSILFIRIAYKNQIYSYKLLKI